jgi:ferric-dicitrate binding protein FerR (iron transport regulator)
MSEDPQHLIEKFWAGTATAADKQRLAEVFGPDEAAWTERLRQEFARHPADADGPLRAEQSARVLRLLRWHLDTEVEAAPVAPRRSGWVRWAAAAVLLLAVGLAVLRVSLRPPAAMEQVARVTVPAAPARELVRHDNPGPAPLRVALPDGSTVTLQPTSGVAYYAPFGAGGRDIRLHGTALFAVAKDAAHPFTVLANGFATTALGTKFRVNAADSQQVAVRLLEGKVVVRATPASHLRMREHFLTPGQELTVNLLTRQVRVERFGPLAAGPRRPLAVEVPTGLAFEKDDLATVFAQVGERYHVRVAYDSADVRGLSFSGSFAATDALPVVLRAVCTVNNLSFMQTPERVIIRKAP